MTRQDVVTVLVYLNLHHAAHTGALEAEVKPADAAEQACERHVTHA